MSLRRTFVCAIFLMASAQTQSNQLHDAAKEGKDDLIIQLINNGADVNEIDYLRGSALHIAAVQKRLSSVKLLIDNGADVNSEEFGKGDTPLHWAALGGDSNVIRYLIDAGADVQAMNDISNTPLHIAAESGNENAAIVLIEYGADIRSKNMRGNAPMHLAGLAGSFDLVNYLKDKGAQFELTDVVSPLLKEADPIKGEETWNIKCSNCHTAHKGGGHDNGPALWNVVGRKIATAADFEYSSEFMRANDVWDFENLNGLLLDARNFYPGTKMERDDNVYVPDVQDRANIILFLVGQSDEPVQLPK